MSQDQASPNAGGAEAPQPGGRDSGLAALCVLGAYHRIAAQPEQLAHDLGLQGRHAGAEHIVRGAKALGLKARIIRRKASMPIATMPLPAIVEMVDGRFLVLAARAGEDRYRLVDPLTHGLSEMSEGELGQAWTRRAVLVARRPGFGPGAASFGFRWFVPSIWRYRTPIIQVLVASLFIQLCGLVTPLFFQLTIDKVLLYGGYSTLVMITAGLVGLGLFHVILQHLRTYLLTHTTSRIDVELGARIFDHLLRLPLAYFETRPAGQTVARMREIETIRSFLTGQGLTSLIDLLFAVVFFAVLALYSPLLTLVVAASLPLYVIVAAVLRPLLRDSIEQRFNTGAASQQFLVESIVGVQTLKAAAIEPSLRVQWEEKLASYVRTSFRSTMLASLGQNTIGYINKVTTALVLFLGAKAVMEGSLSVGGLIAFNMIMGQATAPILRLSQLWQDFQQVQISVERIGDILDSRPESRPLSQAHLPPAQGAIKLEHVGFRYRPGGAEVLRDVSLAIPAGQVLGIVGPSGSGKSTFTKLLQRLYSPERGRILVDDIDVAQVDPAWLRRQIGVVLQENLLFNRSVHDNIALAHPAMPRAQVIALARLAGAHDFITSQPLGYDTIIEERGANLSGGQRQRIAIARALATNPRILILDEATSALDLESEQVIQRNMREIAHGRTVIIIAHRLAAVRNCDRIIAFEDGALVEDGTPRELLARQTSLFGRLWRLQAADDLSQAA